MKKKFSKMKRQQMKKIKAVAAKQTGRFELFL